ncbi:MAG: class I SAM-dependent methyltransferase [Verrucomicrobiota bacterium]|nr:class I SAM-dependent methyltransferase [Verrucomicrobiota bacterium]
MNPSSTAVPLHQQLQYYRARASEYNEWWLRQGRYDRGAELNAQWFAEAAEVAAALAAFRPFGRVLELACGTGNWSEKLLPFATHLTALDGSPEMLAINAARFESPRVRYIEADIFQWQPTDQFDTIFFGFWLSHVPPDRFDAFWQLVRACLAPGGRVFFVDSRREPTSTALDHRLPESETPVLTRRLNDGREFQIFKLFYEPSQLTERLRNLGWHFEIHETDHYFIHGTGQG